MLRTVYKLDTMTQTRISSNKMKMVIILMMMIKNSLSEVERLDGLRLVHVVYRHGDRTPCDHYPTDPYKESSNWPVGPGQLTSIGKRMHFELGQWLRNRYDGFLSSNYSEEEIYVRSTDIDRTLMSAESNLAGLFPPSGYWKWQPDLAWQPVPVHTRPSEEDNLLSNHHTLCERLTQMRDEVLQGPEMRKIYEDNKDFFEYISKHSGWNVDNLKLLDYIYDTLLIEDFYNKTLPDWTKSVFPGGKFEKLRNLVFLTDSFNNEMQRLQAGPFLSELVDHFSDVTKGSLVPQNRKMFMYSAHDTTLSFILNSLHVYDGLAPPYASALLFELFDYEDSWSIRILYRNDTTTQPYVLTLPGCEELCTLEKFQELTASVRPSDWASECQLKEEQRHITSIILAAVIASLMCVCGVLLYAVVGLKSVRDRKGYENL